MYKPVETPSISMYLTPTEAKRRCEEFLQEIIGFKALDHEALTAKFDSLPGGVGRERMLGQLCGNCPVMVNGQECELRTVFGELADEHRELLGQDRSMCNNGVDPVADYATGAQDLVDRRFDSGWTQVIVP